MLRLLRLKNNFAKHYSIMSQPLTITAGRLINTIHETAAFGAHGVWGTESTETGVKRLALGDEDKNVRDWFVAETKTLGCEVKVDAIGNIFATYPGKKKGLATAMGSHLDTQPTGGRYDGILGVLAGLEVLRTFKDNGYVPEYPVAAVVWCNEEGARFPFAVMGSSVWGGQLPLEEAYNLVSVADKGEVTVKDELLRIGYLGEVAASYKENPIAAHFELHIEQGPVLEDNNKEIGVVVGVQSYAWFNIHVKGRASHAGTTHSAARQDAMLCAAKMITKGYEIATKHGAYYTTGILTLEPGSINVIAEEVKFTVDLRHTQDDVMEETIQEMTAAFEEIASVGNGIAGCKSQTLTMEHIYTSPAIHFNKSCIEAVTESTLSLFKADEYQEIVSGAGHDSCAASTRCPTSMIFIPSREGISHNPIEYSTPEQVHNGFNVLMNAVMIYDKKRTE